MASPPIIILGLDGATWDLLGPWMDEGRLPHLSRLCATGAWGTVRSVYPPGTGPAWATLATGVGPGKHGIYEFMRRRAGGYRLSPVNGSALRRLTLWDIIGGEGGASCLLNVPMTYPPRSIEGILISGILTPPGCDSFSYPPSMSREIQEIVPGYQVMPRATYRPGRAAAFLAELERSVSRKGELLLALARRKKWDLLFQVWNETDMAQHALWHLADESHPKHDRREAAGAPEALLSLYRRLDEIIGRLLEQQSGEALVAVVSDHGAGPLHRLIHANNWLLEHGILAVSLSGLSRVKHAAFRAGVTPMGVYRAANRVGLGHLKTSLRWTQRGYDLMRRLFFSFADVDWTRTTAYGVGGGVSGGIFLNVRGREPAGIVSPGAPYERAREEVASSLMEIADPLDGRRIVGRVYRREEIYDGPHLPEAPDLVMVPRDPVYGVFGDFEFSSHRVVDTSPPALSGHHRMEGVLVLWGGAVEAGSRLHEARLQDVAPTLLHLSGIAPSADMDGRVLEEAIMDDWMAEHPVRPRSRPALREDESSLSGFLPGEEEDIKRRFRDLGYIS